MANPTPNKTAGALQQAANDALKATPLAVTGLGAGFVADPAVFVPDVQGAISSLLRVPADPVQLHLQRPGGPGKVMQLQRAGAQVELTVLGGTGKYKGTLLGVVDAAAALLEQWRAQAKQKASSPAAAALVSAYLAGLDGFERLKAEVARFQGEPLTPKPVIANDAAKASVTALYEAVTGSAFPLAGAPGNGALPVPKQIETAMAAAQPTVFLSSAGQRLVCVRGSKSGIFFFEDTLMPSPYQFAFNPKAIHERLKFIVQHEGQLGSSFKMSDGRLSDG